MAGERSARSTAGQPPAGADSRASSSESLFEDVIDRYFEESGIAAANSSAVLAASTAPARTGSTPRASQKQLLRDASRGVRSHSSIYQRMRRNVRPSTYFFCVAVAGILAIGLWSVMLVYAIDVDPNSAFAPYTLIRRQQALALAGGVALLISLLLIRSALQIWRGTRRYREFPPRRPQHLRPPALLRGIDAERSGAAFLHFAMALSVVAVSLLVATFALVWRQF